MPPTTRHALLSVSDKTGLVTLAQRLVARGFELISTGGTREHLRKQGVPTHDLSDFTLLPEMLDGRVKTLHPAVHAGILAQRERPEHLETLEQHEFPLVDVVVCNLYPFAQVLAQADSTPEEIIENIDIGGVTLLRGAAKNYRHVAVLSSPAQYEAFEQELSASGETSLALREKLAREAFAHTAQYDATIARYFQRDEPLPQSLTLTFQRQGEKLRYGENPHQPAAFYVEPDVRHPSVATAQVLHGKELSYNNLLDLDSAFNLVREFAEPSAVVVKHNNPCGAASAPRLAEAFQLAFEGDPVSAFGGIIAFNQPVDEATAMAMTEENRFVECIIAPDYEPQAFAVLTTRPTWKKNVRILRTGPLNDIMTPMDFRRVDGGLLVQARDRSMDDPTQWKLVTQRAATEEEMLGLQFAWRVVKHEKSNAIVLVQGRQLVGVGAGQMSRVDSTGIAIRKAGAKARGAVLASDAFFPFRDNIDAAAAAGITAIVQPGGSMRDAESIAACDEHGIAMLMTGVRHFRH